MDGDDANRPNINDIRALDTLTNFLRVPHETASDIVNMFSYMTVEDVTARMQRANRDTQAAGPSNHRWSSSRQKRRPNCLGGAPSAQKPPSPPPLTPNSPSEKPTIPGKVSLSEYLDPSLCRHNFSLPLPPAPTTSTDDSEELDEEHILEKLTIPHAPRPPHHKSSTKFDNFLEDKEEEDEDDNKLCDDPYVGDILQEGGYQASFMSKEDLELVQNEKSLYLASLNKNLSKRRPVSTDSSEEGVEEEVYEEAAKFLVSTDSETSTGTSVPEKSPAVRVSHSRSSFETPSPPIQDSQNKNKNFSGREHERHMGKNTGKDRVEKRRNSWKNRSETPSDLESTTSAEALEDEISLYIQQRAKQEQRWDTEEDSEDSSSEDICCNNNNARGSMVDPNAAASLQNPGEVDPEGEWESQTQVQHRCLDFKSVKPPQTESTAESTPQTDPDEQGSKDSESQEGSDEVVPFVLDEDFDYDNGVLTPKFSAEEMAYLNSFTSGRNPSHI